MQKIREDPNLYQLYKAYFFNQSSPVWLASNFSFQ